MNVDKKIKKQWKTEFKKYILPYYKDSGQKLDKTINYREYLYTFTEKKVQLVYYKNLNWFDSLKYPRSKGWLIYDSVASLGETDMNFLKALVQPLCHRRIRQTIELCCDIYDKEPTMLPIRIDEGRVHPGNTLIHSLKILNKGCKIIRISNLDFRDNAIILKNIKSISDIQKIYQNKKIYAFFCNKEKYHGMQILVPHGNFTLFDENGNLRWKSDIENWPFEEFLKEIITQTKDITNSSNIIFTYNKNEYSLNIPNDKNLRKEIFLNTIRWGNKNIKF